MSIQNVFRPVIGSVLRGVFGGAGSVDNPLFLDVTQDRSSYIENIDIPTQITDEDLNRYHIFHLVPNTGTPPHAISLPAYSEELVHTKVIIVNHDEININIVGNRNTSINGEQTITTNAKYITVLNNRIEFGSSFIDFVTIPLV